LVFLFNSNNHINDLILNHLINKSIIYLFIIFDLCFLLTRQGKKDVEVAYKRLSFQLGRAQGKKVELAAKLKEQSAELASKLEGLAQQHASDLASLQAAHEEKVRKMANAHEKGIERASVVHDKEMEKLEKPQHRPTTPTNLSKFYIIRSSKTPTCASDIDSPHQMQSNEMSNSTNRRSSSGQIRPLLPISFAIHVLTESLQRPNYRNFTS
jgi:hypothetical protein